MNAPIVSILLSCYNHEDYIEEAIDSVMNQTLQDFEVLLTDDGSTDSSREVIERTIKKYHSDARIHYTPHEHNTGFRCIEDLYPTIKGRYVAGLGSDDKWEPEKLKRQVEFLDNHPEYKACFTWIKVLQDNSEAVKKGEKFFNIGNKSRVEWIRSFYNIGNQLCAPSMMVNSLVWKEMSGYDYGYRQLQDYDLWLRLLMKYEIYVLPEKLTIYRRHANNLSDPSDAGIRCGNLLELENIWYEFMKEVSEELFMKIFYPDEVAVQSSGYDQVEICCKKFMMLINGTLEFRKQIAIRYWNDHRHDTDFIEMLEKRYDYSRNDMFNFRAKESLYRTLYDLTMENGLLRKMHTLLRVYAETINKSDEEMVSELLDLIDGKECEGQVRYTEDYLLALYRVCRQMKDGNTNFLKILNALNEKKMLI